MQRYYDSKFDRLIYVDKAATDQFWDEHWQTDEFRKAITSSPNNWVVKITKKYLSVGSRIIEGGCGQANNVYALHKNGLLIPENSPALLNSINTLLSDEALRQRLGKNAYKTILKNNSIEQAIINEYSVYQNLDD